jgi:putative transposase
LSQLKKSKHKRTLAQAALADQFQSLSKSAQSSQWRVLRTTQGLHNCRARCPHNFWVSLFTFVTGTGRNWSALPCFAFGKASYTGNCANPNVGSNNIGTMRFIYITIILLVSDSVLGQERVDLTYFTLGLVSDYYGRTIVKADDGPLQALRMALRNRMYPTRKLIHHSDRGFQYCNPKYTEVLEANRIKISMTTKYDPYENAVAERVNGTIKNELIVLESLPAGVFAHKSVRQSIETYNTRRPHLSLHYRTPIEAHTNPNFKLKKWTKYFRKKTNTRQGIN